MRENNKKHVSKHSEKNLNASKAIRKNPNKKNDGKKDLKLPIWNVRTYEYLLVF